MHPIRLILKDPLWLEVSQFTPSPQDAGEDEHVLRDVGLVEQEGAVVALEAGQEGAQPLLLVLHRRAEPQPADLQNIYQINFSFSIYSVLTIN